VRPDILIAVDPGSAGAIAIKERGGEPATFQMPETRGDAIVLFRKLLEFRSSAVAYIEKISGFIPDGGASQMFEFGKSVERIGCILETLGCPVIEIPPQAWQKELSLGKSDRKPGPRCPNGLTKKQQEEWKQQNSAAIKDAKAWNAIAKRDWKNKLKSLAQQRYPQLDVTLKNCDALLILEVARKLENQKLL